MAKNSDTAVEATNTEADKLGATIKKVLEEVLPAIAAMQGAQQAKMFPAKPLPASAGGHCHQCKQYKVACKGKHRQAVVFPRNPNYANDFPGVKLNGRVYRSNSYGHQVTVPHDCNIEYMVAEWERNEDELKLGKQKQHHSGRISPTGASINPLTPNSFIR